MTNSLTVSKKSNKVANDPLAIETVIKRHSGLFKRVDDIEVPDILFNPIKTGTPEFDRAYSEMGGVTPSCVTLVTGTPGAGKTTLMSTLGARLISPRPVVVLSYEMSDFQLKLTAKKIKSFDKMLIVTEEFHKESKEAFSDFLFGALKELNPAMVIVDSLQKMAGVMKGSFNANQIWVTEELTKFAKETYIPVNMIGHVSKDGTYKGPTTIKHEVDAHMHIEIDKEIGERTFVFTKNRFGGVADPYIFRISNHGVFIGNEFWERPENKDTLNMAKTAVKEFVDISSRSINVPYTAFQNMTKVLVRHFQTKYSDQLKNDSVVGNNEIRLTWNGARVFCKPALGILNFGPKFIKGISDKNKGNVGYKVEKDFIKASCRTKEEVCMWIIMHEFQHLFNGNDKHVKSFFQKITDMWNENTELLTA